MREDFHALLIKLVSVLGECLFLALGKDKALVLSKQNTHAPRTVVCGTNSWNQDGLNNKCLIKRKRILITLELSVYDCRIWNLQPACRRSLVIDTKFECPSVRPTSSTTRHCSCTHLQWNLSLNNYHPYLLTITIPFQNSIMRAES